MKNKQKQMFMFLSVLFILCVAMGAVSAADDTSDVTVSDDIDTIEADIASQDTSTDETITTSDNIKSSTEDKLTNSKLENQVVNAVDNSIVESDDATINFGDVVTANVRSTEGILYTLDMIKERSDISEVTINLEDGNYQFVKPIIINTAAKITINGNNQVMSYDVGSTSKGDKLSEGPYSTYYIVEADGRGAITNLVIEGYNSEEGAVINHGILDVTNCIFRDNTAANSASAIYSDGTLTVKDSTFENNIVELGPNRLTGAIYATGDVYINNSVFTGNIAEHRDVASGGSGGQGGAISFAGNSLIVGNSTFTNNEARFGGAIIVDSATGEVLLAKNKYEGNHALYGGALYICTDVIVNDSEFNNNYVEGVGSGNNAPNGGTMTIADAEHVVIDNVKIKDSAAKDKGLGGAIAVFESDVTVINSLIEDCTAVSSGGMIYVRGNITLNNSNFTNGKSTNSFGGAVAIYRGSNGATKGTEIIENCIFKDNYAKGASMYSGGAVATFVPTKIDNCTFEGNEGPLRGAAVHCGSSNTNITNSKFIANEGSNVVYGANIIDNCLFDANTVSSGPANTIKIISNSNFTNNVATGIGGAVVGTSNITDCIFINNAGTRGGAIFTTGMTNITNSNFTRNTAENGSAIFTNYVHSSGVGVTIKDCNFIENEATEHGGAIYNNKTLSIENSLFENNLVSTQSPNDYRGGAIYSAGNLTVDISRFNSNVATHADVNGGSGGQGGAIAFIGNNMTVSNSNFTNNEARFGGAIIVGNEANNTLITGDNLFEGNHALYGGALYICANTTVDGAKFDNNYVEGVGSGNNAPNGGTMTIADAENVTINNIIINHGDAKDTGLAGAIAVFESDVTVNNSLIENCTAYGSGGMIYVRGNITLNNSNFTNGKSTNSFGGAVAIYRGSNGATKGTEVIENCVFKDNYAKGASMYSGGAVATFVPTKIDNCTFEGNEGPLRGAAVHCGSSNTNISNSKFIANEGSNVVYGANIIDNSVFEDNVVSSGPANTIKVISNSNFTRNTASGLGGAVVGTSNVTDCIFTENIASRGGAIGTTGRTNISNCSFVSNTAENGSAIYANNVAGVTVKDSNFTQNDASLFGTIYNNRTITVDNCTFENNFAFSNGAGIYTAGNSTVNNCTFKENVVTSAVGSKCNGGAAITVSGIPSVAAKTFINNTVFDSNVATHNDVEPRGDGGEGGAIALLNNTEEATIANSTFTNNEARFGGAISIDHTASESNVLIVDNEFTENSALYGGAIAVYNPATIENNTFTSNVAQGEGSGSNTPFSGAIMVMYTDNVVIKNDTFTENNAGAGVGGAISITNGASAQITESTFKSNVAEGGVIYNTGTTVFEDNECIDNTNGDDILIISDIEDITVNNNIYTGNLLEVTIDPIEDIVTDTEFTEVPVTMTLREVYNDLVRDGNITVLINGVEVAPKYEIVDGETTVVLDFTTLQRTTDADNPIYNEITLQFTNDDDDYQDAEISFNVVSTYGLDTAQINVEDVDTKVNDTFTITVGVVDDETPLEGDITFTYTNEEGTTQSVTKELTEGTFTSEELSVEHAGTYTVSVTYNGNNLYLPQETEFTITVDKLETEITVGDVLTNATQEYTIVAEVLQATEKVNGGTVTFTDSEGIPLADPVEVADGEASITLTSPEQIVYDINAIYSGTDDLYGDETTATVTVDLLATTTESEDVVGNVTKAVTLTANVNDDSGAVNDGSVLFIDAEGNTLGEADVVEGVAQLPYTFDAIYNDIVTVRYTGTNVYNVSESTINVKIDKLATKITTYAIDEINLGENTQIMAILSSDDGVLAQQPIVVTINNVPADYTTNEFALVEIVYNAIKAGEDTVTIDYEGTEIYEASTADVVITVNPIDTTTTVNYVVSTVNTNVDLVADVTASYGPVNEGKVTFYVDDVEAGEALVTSGVATLENYQFATGGNKVIKAVFNGTDNYITSEGTALASISKATLVVSGEDVSGFVGDSITITVGVTGNTTEIAFNVIFTDAEGNILGQDTLSDESASIEYVFNSAYDDVINVEVVGDDTYETVTYQLNAQISQIPTEVIADNVDAKVSELVTITVEINPEDESIVSEGSVIFTDSEGNILGTDDDIQGGLASIDLTFDEVMTDTITISYTGSDKYADSSKDITITVTQVDAPTMDADDVTGFVGSNVNIAVTLSNENEDSITGTVTFTDADGNVLGSADVAENAASIDVVFDAPYDDMVTATFTSTIYETTSIEIPVTISKVATTVSVDDITAKVFETVNIVAHVSADDDSIISEGSVVFTDSEGNEIGSSPVENGIASIEKIYDQEYADTITATYVATDKYAENEDTFTINIAKLGTEITVLPYDPIVYGDIVTIHARITDENGAVLSNVPVSVTVYDVTLPAQSDNYGLVTVIYESTHAGEDSIVFDFAGNSTYEATAATAELTIDKAQTTTNVSYVIATALDKVIINATVSSIVSPINEGTIEFFIGETSIGTADVSENVASLEYTIDKAGTFEITAVYSNSDNYIGSEGTNVLYVSPLDTTTTSEDVSARALDEVTLTANVIDANGNNVVDGGVIFTDVDGNELGTSDVVDGIATINVVFDSAYDDIVTVSYTGSEAYAPSETTINVAIRKLETTLNIISNNEINLGESTTIAMQLVNENGPLAEQTVIVTIDGVESQLETNDVGLIYVDYTPSSAGVKDISVLFEENDANTEATAEAQITVKALATSTIVNFATTDVGGTETFTAEVTSSLIVNEGKITFYIDDTEIASVDVENGIATIDIPFETAGTYTIKAVYNGTDNFSTSEATNTVMVNKIETSMEMTVDAQTVGKETVITAFITAFDDSIVNDGVVVFTDKDGNEIATVDVESGKATTTHVFTDAYKGLIKAHFTDSTNYIDSKAIEYAVIESLKTTTTLDDVSAITGKDVTITATVESETGEEISIGIVTFTDGKDLNEVASVEEGVASITITTPTYWLNETTITAVYTDDSNVYLTSNDTTIPTTAKTQTITTVEAVEGTVLTEVTLTAHVTDIDGNDITGGRVLFKVNGFSVTDADGNPVKVNVINGVATASVVAPKSWMSDATISASFLSNNYYDKSNSETNTITLEKIATTVTTEPITVKVGQEVTITARVVDANGDVVSGGRVGFKVNGAALKDADGNILYANVQDGEASITYVPKDNWDKENPTIMAIFGGNAYYDTSRSDENPVTVDKYTTTTMVAPVEATVNGKATITAFVTDNEGNAVTTGRVKFTLNDEYMKNIHGNDMIVTVDNGFVSVTYTVREAVEGTLKAVYLGDARYITSTSEGTTYSIKE